jgi:hypothetical protein
MSLIRSGSTFSGLAARIVDVNLITQIPVDTERACEELRTRRHPLPPAEQFRGFGSHPGIRELCGDRLAVGDEVKAEG